MKLKDLYFVAESEIFIKVGDSDYIKLTKAQEELFEKEVLKVESYKNELRVELY